MLTLTLSANKLEKAACLARFYYHAILKRKPAGGSPGADAGSCVHAAFAAMNRAESTEAQNTALATERAKRPMLMRSETKADHCTLPYLTDALAVLRAEWAATMPQWNVLEVERRATRRLGERVFDVHSAWFRRLPGYDLTPAQEANACIGDGAHRVSAAIDLEFVRDCVLQHRTTGEVWVVDLKTASQDRRTDVASYRTSDQGKLYTWTARDEWPERNVCGIQFIRLVMREPVLRKSDKTKPTYEVLPAPPIRHSDDVLAEWKRGVLSRAADLLRRNPDDPADWPLVAVSGTCVGPYGTCGYLPTCDLSPASRLTHLTTDAYQPSDAGKEVAEAETADA